MFSSVADFLAAWRRESACTARVLGAIPPEALGFQGEGRGRSLGALAWHLAQSVREISRHTGLEVSGPARDDPMPDTGEGIRAAYERAAASLANAVEGSWFDGTLGVKDDVYGESWPRGRTLFVLLCHEVHHRGQLTLLLRQAGVPVPEVYGPTGES